MCCTTDACTNAQPRLLGLRKQAWEAHTSTIFVIVGLYALLYCGSPRWHIFASVVGVGAASTLHHARPQQRSFAHWWDNTQLVCAATMYTFTAPPLPSVAVCVAVYAACYFAPVAAIKMASTAAIVADFAFMLAVVPHEFVAPAVLLGCATAVCYASVNYHWAVHSAWHFLIAWWGSVGGMGLAAAAAAANAHAAHHWGVLAMPARLWTL